MVAQPSTNTREVEAGRDLCEFEANLVYKASFRTAMSVRRRNPVSKNKKSVKIIHLRKKQMARVRVKNTPKQSMVVIMAES